MEGREMYVNIEDNIVISVRPGFVLTSDRRPAGIYSSHPFVILEHNTVVGSAIGFYLDFKVALTFAKDICPMGHKIKMICHNTANG